MAAPASCCVIVAPASRWVEVVSAGRCVFVAVVAPASSSARSCNGCSCRVSMVDVDGGSKLAAGASARDRAREVGCTCGLCGYGHGVCRLLRV